MTLRPTFADFSGAEVRTANASVGASGAWDAGDHWVIDAGGTLRVRFPAEPQSDELTLTIRGLVSKSGPAVGYAPLDILVNDRALISGLRTPGGGDLPQTMPFAVPGDWLVSGVNTLELRSAEDSRTMYWVYELLLESVWDRDAARRALLAEHAKESALTFATYSFDADRSAWRPGPPLRVWIDDGLRSPLAELTWRTRDGGESTVTPARELGRVPGRRDGADRAPRVARPARQPGRTRPGRRRRLVRRARPAGRRGRDRLPRHRSRPVGGRPVGRRPVVRRPGQVKMIWPPAAWS
jgi:hypothetical protein